MRISHERRFIFLSRYKCASTSLRRALDPFSDIKSTQLYPYYHHATLARIEAHFAEMGWPFERYFIFTTMRDPREIVASMYDYGQPDRDGVYWWERDWDAVVRGDKISKADRAAKDPPSFRDWVMEADLSRFVLDSFVRDASGAIRADAILRVENLDAEFAPVAERLSLQDVAVPQVNVSQRESRPFSPEMLDRVREVFGLDIELGGYRF